MLGTVLGITQRTRQTPEAFPELHSSLLSAVLAQWTLSLHSTLEESEQGTPAPNLQPLIAHLSQMLSDLGLLTSIVAKWSLRS